MACMIAFSLRDSMKEVEQSLHHSKLWHKSLTLLRDLGRVDPYRSSSDHSYCCVDREHPNEVIYLYPHCSDKKLKAIEASCTSKTSKLARTLNPLVNQPLSAASISKFEDEIDLVYPALVADHAIKNLELITINNLKRPMMLSGFFEPHRALSSQTNLATVPVKSFSTTWFNFEERNCFCCIEWKSLDDRAAVLSDSLLRSQLKSVNTAHRVPFLKALGKSEEDLTWEEDFDVFLRSTGAKDVQRRFVTARFVTDEYLGLGWRTESCCVIL